MISNRIDYKLYMQHLTLQKLSTKLVSEKNASPEIKVTDAEQITKQQYYEEMDCY